MAAGVDWIQLRERDLSARSQFELAATLAESARLRGVRLFINDRADIAARLGLGVHLTTRSLTAATIRRTFGAELFIGVSTHTLAEAREAERGGANFVVFGPVFETASKRAYGEPVGLAALKMVTAALQIPVLALGGIKLSNLAAIEESGAAGIAAISLFTEADDLAALVRTIKHPVF